MTTNIQIIDFHGDNIVAVEINGKPYVAVKPICEALGLDWSAQFRRIKDDPILSEGIALGAIPFCQNNQETTCLSLELVNGWLFSISLKYIKNETAKQSLIRYRRECYRVLYEHFFGKASVQSANAISIEPVVRFGGISVPLAEWNSKLRAVELACKVHNNGYGQWLWHHLDLPHPAKVEYLPPMHPMQQTDLFAN